MKKLLIFVICIVLLSACGKLKEAKETMDAVKQFAETAGDVSEVAKSLEDIDIEKVKLTEKEVKKFYSGVKKLNDKYPDIHFQIATMAAIEASMAGKNLKEIISKEMDISFDEYSKLSVVITYAAAVGVGYEMTKSFYEQTKASRDELKKALNNTLTEEEKKNLEEQIENIEKSITELEEEMKKEEYNIVKENYEIIKKVKDELEL